MWSATSEHRKQNGSEVGARRLSQQGDLDAVPQGASSQLVGVAIPTGGSKAASKDETR